MKSSTSLQQQSEARSAKNQALIWQAAAGELPLDWNHLLGREVPQVESVSIRESFAGKVVLVTGAAGSIGSELCREILRYEPAKLICLDHNETGLFYLQRGLCQSQGQAGIDYCVQDFSQPEPIRRIFSGHQIHIVFHAAGYKHVPIMEENPRAALENNVFGLIRFWDVCEDSGCENFVLISSDKAVNPTNVMGCTKRFGELILAAHEARMRCVSVRFGNVLGSQGSVVPIFQKQIMEKQPLTVTHPEVTRFFIAVDEAVSLLLQASVIGKRGEILALEMGQPIRILDLARMLIRFAGKSEEDVEIVFSGLRPGEKLHEELFSAGEEVLPTVCERIKRISSAIPSWAELGFQLEALRRVLYSVDDHELRAQIQRIIPEYRFEVLRHQAALSHDVVRSNSCSPVHENAVPKALITRMATSAFPIGDRSQ